MPDRTSFEVQDNGNLLSVSLFPYKSMNIPINGTKKKPSHNQYSPFLSQMPPTPRRAHTGILQHTSIPPSRNRINIKPQLRHLRRIRRENTHTTRLNETKQHDEPEYPRQFGDALQFELLVLLGEDLACGWVGHALEPALAVPGEEVEDERYAVGEDVHGDRDPVYPGEIA